MLEICSNLIILDEFGCCRLAHLSVIGFLLRTDEPESQGGLFTTAQAHAQIAERCLAFVRQHSLKAQCLDEILPVGIFPSYAAFCWTHHCTGASHYRSLAPLSSLFPSFLNTISPSPAFEAWSELMFKVSTMGDPFRDQDQSPDRRIHRTEMSYRFRHRMLSISTSLPFHDFVASSFGFIEILPLIPTLSLQTSRGRKGECCMHFAAWSGRIDTVEQLIKLHANSL